MISRYVKDQWLSKKGLTRPFSKVIENYFENIAMAAGFIETNGIRSTHRLCRSKRQCLNANNNQAKQDELSN